MIVDRLSAKPAAPPAVETVHAGRAATAASAPSAAGRDVEAGADSFSARLSSVAAPEIGRAPGLVRHEARKVSPEEKFEGFVLRTFVEEMLPSEEGGFFGTGMAGNVWRSMLAEQIGDELAASGGVGIAEMLAKRDAKGLGDLPSGPDPASLASALGTGPAGALSNEPES